MESALDTGQIQQVIEKNTMIASADGTGQRVSFIYEFTHNVNLPFSL
jgi:hypothetical protein